MADETMRVAAIGSGERFQSLVTLMQASGNDVVTWLPGRDEEAPDNVEIVELDDLRDIHVIFLALPFSNLRETAREIGDVIGARHAIVHACHNLEDGSLATASEVLLEETPTRRFGFLTGPMRAEDVARGLPAAGVCASRFPEVWDLAEAALVHPGFRLYRSRDLLGAEHAASYGRVIAMAGGVASEMKLGHSVLSTLFARGLAEVARWVTHCGGQERTTFGIAGAGNLHLDTNGIGSVDFQVGADAMREGVFDPIGVRKKFGTAGRDLLDLIESLRDGVEHAGIQAHLLETCHFMVSGEMEPAQALAHLMTLPTLDD